MCEENLTLDRVETWTIPALKEYTGMKKRHERGLPVRRRTATENGSYRNFDVI